MTAVSSDLRSLAALAAADGPPPAKAVAREFEALLLGEVMRAAARPLPGGDGLDGGSTGQMYREQFFAEVARLASQQGGFGLARAIERQLEAAAGRRGEA